MKRQTENMIGFALKLSIAIAQPEAKVDQSIIFRSGIEQILVIFLPNIREVLNFPCLPQAGLLLSLVQAKERRLKIIVTCSKYSYMRPNSIYLFTAKAAKNAQTCLRQARITKQRRFFKMSFTAVKKPLHYVSLQQGETNRSHNACFFIR